MQRTQGHSGGATDINLVMITDPDQEQHHTDTNLVNDEIHLDDMIPDDEDEDFIHNDRRPYQRPSSP